MTFSKMLRLETKDFILKTHLSNRLNTKLQKTKDVKSTSKSKLLNLLGFYLDFCWYSRCKNYRMLFEKCLFLTSSKEIWFSFQRNLVRISSHYLFSTTILLRKWLVDTYLLKNTQLFRRNRFLILPGLNQIALN